MSGCPGHTATLEYQSVSNSLCFTDGKGQEIYMQTPELETFLCMLRSLGKSNVDINLLLENTFS